MKIMRNFVEGNRYYFDGKLCSTAKGWAQVDTSQDAWYYGIWTNPFEMKTVSYVEGDIIIEIADNEEEYCQAIKKLKNWNVKYGYQFYGIDPGFNKLLREKFIKIGLEEFLY